MKRLLFLLFFVVSEMEAFGRGLWRALEFKPSLQKRTEKTRFQIQILRFRSCNWQSRLLVSIEASRHGWLARSLSPATPSLSSGSGGLSECLWTLIPMLSLKSVETQSCSFFFVPPPLPPFFLMLCLVAEKMRGKRSVKFETFESYVFVVLCLGANGSVYLRVEIINNFLNFDVLNFCFVWTLCPFGSLLEFLFNKLLSLSDEPQNDYCVVWSVWLLLK